MALLIGVAPTVRSKEVGPTEGEVGADDDRANGETGSG